MKKILFLFLGLFIIVGCTKTTGNSQETVVKEFLEALKNVEFTKLIEYIDCTEEEKAEFLTEFEEFEVDELEGKLLAAMLNYDYNITDSNVKEDQSIVSVEIKTYDYENVISSMAVAVLAKYDEDMTDEELLELVLDVLNQQEKSKSITVDISLVKSDDVWKVTTDSFELFFETVFEDADSLFSGYSYDYDYDYDTYTVDQEKVKASNTILGKGRLEDSSKNEKYIETTLEFIDYNVTNGEGTELDDYNDISFASGKMKIEVEVAGVVGDRFVVSILDEDYEIIEVQTFELASTQEVVVIEATIDPSNSDFSIDIFPESEYQKYGIYGSEVGYAFIWNID